MWKYSPLCGICYIHLYFFSDVFQLCVNFLCFVRLFPNYMLGISLPCCLPLFLVAYLSLSSVWSLSLLCLTFLSCVWLLSLVFDLLLLCLTSLSCFWPLSVVFDTLILCLTFFLLSDLSLLCLTFWSWVWPFFFVSNLFLLSLTCLCCVSFSRPFFIMWKFISFMKALIFYNFVIIFSFNIDS